MTRELIIDVNNLCKTFSGKPAVKNISLKIYQGEIFGFLGPNGSGKTTTIRMLCGLMIPDSGSGSCLGFDVITQSREIKKLVGYVPQTFSLYKDLTVIENLEFIAHTYQMPDSVARVCQMITELELTPYKNQLTGRLSGGWKQRVSLAAALIHEPKILLLDEPTAGVDPKARRDFWNEIHQLAARGISSLVSTHYMDEAERCHRLAYVMNGEMLVEGTVSDIIQKINLVTYSMQGDKAGEYAARIEQEPGIAQIIAWGNGFRISSKEEAPLAAVAKRYPQFTWQPTATTLEDVFVYLVVKQDSV